MNHHAVVILDAPGRTAPPTVGFQSARAGQAKAGAEWHLPYERVTSAQIAGGALANFDVLLVPNGVSTTASNALGATGRKALLDWVNAGGEYVGWRGASISRRDSA